MKRITSRHNAIVARCRAIVRGDERSLVLLDGVHLVSDALDAGISIAELITTADAAIRPEIQTLLARASRAGADTIGVTPAVMAAITPLRSPSGIVALAR